MSNILEKKDDMHIVGLYSKQNEEPLEIKYIYIKHVDSPECYQIPNTAAKHSKLIKDALIDNNNDTYGKSRSDPLIIPNTLKVHTIEFIMKYMIYYDNKPEKCAPDSPLPDIQLSAVFGGEYELFHTLCKFENDDNISDKILKINEYIKSAIYFNFQYLHIKLSAVIAYIIIKNPDKFNILRNT